VFTVGGDEAWANILGLTGIPDRWPGFGPLGGLATALLDGPVVSMVVVVAGDQPWIDPVDVEALVAALAADDRLTAVIGDVGDGRLQPFPSAWRRSAGPGLAALVESGRLGVIDALGSVSTTSIPVSTRTVADVDEPGDLNGPQEP